MFVYYQKGNRRKRVSPDVFVAVGVPKNLPNKKRRKAYFVWNEPHGPDIVIEMTSESTRDEDLDDKMSIYQDEMPVPEYFLFDPEAEYLDPPLQGYRLREGRYIPITMVGNRLPSEVLHLELERDGEWLRFYNPLTRRWLPTAEEREAALEVERQQVVAERERAEAERVRAEAERVRAEAERVRAEAERERLASELDASGKELERLRRELQEWQRRFGNRPGLPPGSQG
jgi:hypothetical protein